MNYEKQYLRIVIELRVVSKNYIILDTKKEPLRGALSVRFYLPTDLLSFLSAEAI